jgi:hypothetical protein
MTATERTASRRLAKLQTAVEELHARLFSDEVADVGAVVPLGVGPSVDAGKSGRRIIRAALSHRHAERFSRWWAGDYSAWEGDPSEADWFGANEAAFQLVRLGLDGPNAAAILEQTLRSGPWRPKWDSRRPGRDDAGNSVLTTILGLLIGKALRRQRARVTGGPTDSVDGTRTDRLEEELAWARTLIENQQSIIRDHQHRTSHLETRLGEIMAVLRNGQLSPTSRVVAVVLGETVERLREYGYEFSDVLRVELARQAGVSESTISREMRKLCADGDDSQRNPAAPIIRSLKSEFREIDGTTRPTSRISIAARTGVGSILAAYATFRPDRRRNHGGKRRQSVPAHSSGGEETYTSPVDDRNYRDQVDPAQA